MTILLIGGGTGGHITPLLAVAHELKALDPDVQLIGVCEKNSKFVQLYIEDRSIDRIFQVRAGKYRRYSGLSFFERISDIKTFLLNVRDAGRTLMGYFEARKLLRELKPDIILVKGGFVAVPIGLAASRLNIPFITHDSDSTPGLANRIISKWALKHATGMPAELYSYPKEHTVYTGIPLSKEFKKVSPALRVSYREQLGLSGCSKVISIIGGSQGAEQLNKDFVSVVSRLMQKHKSLGVVHIAGKAHEKSIRTAYSKELVSRDRERVVVRGFVSDLHVYSGAADIVVTRAGATNTAEFALQGLPIIIVPGQLAGGHQDKNAAYFEKHGAALIVKHGDAEGLYAALTDLLSDKRKQASLAASLHSLSRPHAARELAQLVLQAKGK